MISWNELFGAAGVVFAVCAFVIYIAVWVDESPRTREKLSRWEAFDFAYAVHAAACKPEYGVFKKLALNRGWDLDDFREWADTKAWWEGSTQISVPRRTLPQLAQERLVGVEQLRRVESRSNRVSEEAVRFTCDECGARFTCGYVYDAYNTNGDCLVEK